MNEAMIELLVKLAAVPLVTALAMLAARLLHRAGSYFDAKEKAEKDGTAKDAFCRAMEVLSNSSAEAVEIIENTMRPAMKAATEDGKVSKEEGAALADAAIKLAKEQAQRIGADVLKSAGLDTGLDGIIAHLVEVAAARLAGDSRGTALPAPAAASAATPTPAPGAVGP